MRRRELLLAGLTLPLATLAGAAWPRRAGAAATPFDDRTVPEQARRLAAAPYVAPDRQLSSGLEKIQYDQYRDIRFDPADALWTKEKRPYRVQFFHRGFLYRDRVDVHTVAEGVATSVVYHPQMFSFGRAPAPDDVDLGFAGFRLHAPINRADYFDEVCAFLGASYFRAVARGQVYGLSARGLALKTADPAGEEFPVFKAFWIETPAPGAREIVVHALLDSPSAAGALRFRIVPGVQTVFDTALRLYPRVELDRAGIAPLTSMFHFDASDRVGIDDYRPSVHDSDGLALFNGSGERIWRPLRNPGALQESVFMDSRPRGFGLLQRKRQFADYADSEAHYEKRPSLWVEPVGDWGEGAVHLVEIPTRDEFHDNIVAFWRPRQPLAAGREHRFDYRLHWCDRPQWPAELATIAQTRIGRAEQGGRQIVIELAGGRLRELSPDAVPRAVVSASRGEVANIVAHANAGTGGWRIAFELRPGNERIVELRARLEDAKGPLSETWLYRWTA